MFVFPFLGRGQLGSSPDPIKGSDANGIRRRRHLATNVASSRDAANNETKTRTGRDLDLDLLLPLLLLLRNDRSENFETYQSDDVIIIIVISSELRLIESISILNMIFQIYRFGKVKSKKSYIQNSE